MNVKDKKRINSKKHRQECAAHKQVFLGKIKNICGLVADYDVYRMIPENDLNSIYRSRFMPFKLRPVGKNRISKEKLKFIEIIFNGMIKQTEVPLFENGACISLLEMLTAGLTFYYYLEGLDESRFPAAPEIKKRMRLFFDSEKFIEGAFRKFLELLEHIGICFSHPGSGLIRLVHELEISKIVWQRGIRSIIKIHTVHPEITYVLFEGKKRKAFRVCFASAISGIKYASVNKDLLLVFKKNDEQNIPVYIQNHALYRLYERLDHVYSFIIYM